MDRTHRLSFCTKCAHKKFDSQKGIICGLTNDTAKFYDSCKDFVGNKTEVDQAVKNRQLNKIYDEEHGKYGESMRITEWYVMKVIVLIVTLITLYIKLFT